MTNGIIWLVYAAVVLIISGVVGLHLGRFRQAYTEMTGMMVGMTMGMMNGFVLGYASAAAVASIANAAGSLLWGNFFGMLLGLLLGLYFGRAGGLMGMMDGGMGGVMGGSMGAMLAAMLVFPSEGLLWTAVLLGAIYLVSMVGLVALIEQSAPEHAALHRLMPMFTRAMATEAAEEADRAEAQSQVTSRLGQVMDYYALLGVRQGASNYAIADAYLVRLAEADQADVMRLEQAISILTDPYRREAYDRRLKESQEANGRGDCCPPPRKQRVTTDVAVSAAIPKASAGTIATAAIPTKRKEGTTIVKDQQTRPTNGKQAVPVRSSRGNGAKAQRASQQQVVPIERATWTTVQQQKQPPISPVGIVVGILLAVTLAVWWLMSQGGSPAGVPTSANNSAGGTAPQQIEAQAVVAPIGADGKQSIDFIVNGTNMSYKPNVIKVKQGVPVRFNVSVEGRDPG